MLKRTGLGLACAMLCAGAHAAPLPVEIFTREPVVETVRLSPDGQRAVMIMPAEGTPNVALVDLAGGKPTLLTKLQGDGLGIYNVQWKSDRYLVYQAVVGKTFEPLLAVIDLQTKRHFRLNEDQEWTWLGDLRWSDPDRLLLMFQGGRGRAVAEIRLRETTPYFGYGKRWVELTGASRYFFDSKSVARAAVSWVDRETPRLMYRENEAETWHEVTRFARFADQDKEDDFRPLAFAEDDKQIYVLSNSGRDTLALFRYDPGTRQLGDLEFEAPGVDVTWAVFAPGLTHLVAVRYDAEGKGVHYVDPRAQAIHLATLKALPNVQSELVSFDARMRRVIVRVRSPQTRGSFYLYDLDTGVLRNLIDVSPWIQESQMSPVRAFAASARDGLPLHGYLTLPRGGTGHYLPLIVSLVGDRNGTRHRPDFDPSTQFFASRGYAVLQLNPRGSTGYGRRFREAGYRNWHTGVQNDIADAIQSLIRDDIADARRIGLYGTGFGGYIALLALTTHPNLFKCAITYGGFADPEAFAALKRVWLSPYLYQQFDDSEQRFAEHILGANDDAQANERSPWKNLERIQAPIFIAHGTSDMEVPFSEAQKLARALSTRPGAVTGFMPEGEGHEFDREANRTELFRRLERFLATNLGGEASTPAQSSDTGTPARTN